MIPTSDDYLADTILRVLFDDISREMKRTGGRTEADETREMGRTTGTRGKEHLHGSRGLENLR
jgi:hypothetical protein